MATGGMTVMRGNWNILMAVCINTSISHRTDYMWIFRCGKLWIRNSEQVTVSSGQDVFFISSDAKEWIYVRAKDGTEGYIHVDGENVSNVGRPGTEVFSELNYFD